MSRARRERRLVIGLAVTLGGLLTGIVLVMREDAREPDVAGAPSPADVARIAIERPGFDDVVLAREGTDWRVIAPCALDADESRVEPLLAALAAGGAGYAAGEIDLEAAGLDEPLASVHLDEERVLLGGTDLGGERRYAQRRNRVTLVPEWSLSLVAGGLSAFAALEPFDSPPTRLVRLEPASAHASGSAPAPDSDSIPAPGHGPGTEPAQGADRESVVSIDPSLWSSLAADRIAAWSVADAPPVLERARLRATFADGRTRTLDIVRTERWSALRLDGAGCAYRFGSDTLPAELYR